MSFKIIFQPLVLLLLFPLIAASYLGSLHPDPLQYQRLVRKLNYLTQTRPNLSFDVQFLSRFITQSYQLRWTAALHTLGYVMGTFDHGLFFNNSAIPQTSN